MRRVNNIFRKVRVGDLVQVVDKDAGLDSWNGEVGKVVSISKCKCNCPFSRNAKEACPGNVKLDHRELNSRSYCFGGMNGYCLERR